jgi:xylose isomerase
MKSLKHTRKFSTAMRSEFFPGVSKIQYEGPTSTNPLAYRYYDPDRVVRGKTMKDWLRFSVVYWHTFRGSGLDIFGAPTFTDRPWNNLGGDVEEAKDRAHAAFEFFTKLGVEYYAFHDIDVAPEGKTLAESNANFDAVSDELLKLQKETGVKCLWGTSNMFSHPRFMNGASTNPDFDVFAYSAAKVKKCMEVTVKLGGEGYTFWGGREGYFSLLNTDLRKELDHAGAFFNMAVDYKKKLGANFQMYIEPKPREPTKHQYDYDAQTVIGFLKQYGIEDHFKINVEPNHTTLAGHEFEHDILISSAYGMLGSIDANAGDLLCGWDTDQFNMDVKKSAMIMWCVMNQGGLAPGGLNFDCKVRRESTDLNDLFYAHISAMDVYAQGLIAADQIMSENVLPQMLADRYATFNAGLGAKVAAGTTSFEELEQHALQNEPTPKSGQQELYEAIMNRYVFK